MAKKEENTIRALKRENTILKNALDEANQNLVLVKLNNRILRGLLDTMMKTIINLTV